ncbi:MAG: hypothetical protein EOP51_20605 [Sphingobacteriales bacterium]|nr:MAG: hypothetical protein EOP51_20605 [Sphingobacteriales bacterium]
MAANNSASVGAVPAQTVSVPSVPALAGCVQQEATVIFLVFELLIVWVGSKGSSSVTVNFTV